LQFVVPDRFIRSYRLLRLPEIGKWNEAGEGRCNNESLDVARYYASHAVPMSSRTLRRTPDRGEALLQGSTPTNGYQSS
jgi:hypothetical protein